MNPLHIAKVSVQEREGINKIVKVTKELILEFGIDNISHYSIAKAVGIPASSILSVFPIDSGAINGRETLQGCVS